jgi:hypothetical protein
MPHAKWTVPAAPLAAVALGAAVACSADTEPYAGGLMLAIQTDLAAPKDISAIGLYITSDGRPIFADTRDVAPAGEVKFPATIAIIGDANRPRAIIKIRVIAFEDSGDVRVLRDIITTIRRGGRRSSGPPSSGSTRDPAAASDRRSLRA